MQKKGIYVTYMCTVLCSIGNKLNMPIGCQLCSGFEGGLCRVSSREEAQVSLWKHDFALAKEWQGESRRVATFLNRVLRTEHPSKSHT